MREKGFAPVSGFSCRLAVDNIHPQNKILNNSFLLHHIVMWDILVRVAEYVQSEVSVLINIKGQNGVEWWISGYTALVGHRRGVI